MQPARKRSTPWLAAALAGLAALAVLAGCGGGGTGTLTKTEFVAKGDAICKHAHDQYAALQKNPPSSAPEIAALTQKLIEISNSELSQIRALAAPSEVQPALDSYLKAREQGIALLQTALKAAQNKDARAYAAAQAKVAATQVSRLKLAQAVGFSQCSRPVTASSTGGG